MSKWKTWLVLAVIFLAGAVTGSMLTVGLGPRLMPNHPPGMQEIKHFWLMHLTRHLGLTPDQQAKIEPILSDASNQLQAIHRDEAGQASRIIEQTNQRIATLLTPDQQAKLQVMEKEMDRDRDRMFPGHHNPWGGLGPHHGPGFDDVPPPPPPPVDTGTNSAPVNPTP